MPIPFSCPHCGNSVVVEDHYAGQTGPCANCGQPITIPPPVGAPGTAVGAGPLGVLGVVLAVGVVGLVLCVGVAGMLVALAVPAVGKAKQASTRASSQNNLRQILLALHSYHDANGSFPPAFVADSNGTPLYSWRVLILPYMQQQAIYDRFDKSRAWDDPINLQLSSFSIPAFRSPSDEAVAPDGASYFCLVGPNTAFPGSKGRKLNDITDGVSMTVFLIELQDISGSWAAPIDPNVDEMQPVIGDGSNQLHPAQPEGVLVGLGDGSVRYLTRDAAGRSIQPIAFGINDGVALPLE